MTEDLFQYLWQMKLFNQVNLVSTDGDPIEIISVGQRNYNSGPDFFNAKIKISGTLWAGNIELHIKASDWELHQHQHDMAYNTIVLHVVYENNKSIADHQGNPIKTLELKNHINKEHLKNYEVLSKNKSKIACEKSLHSVPTELIQTRLEALMIQRLNKKSNHIEGLLAEHQHHWEYCFYIQLAANFGFKVNQVPFELVARNTSLQVLSKHKTNLVQTEALLFGQAGFLHEAFHEDYPLLLQNEYSFLKKKYQLVGIDKHLWKFSRMRPVNFPTIRIAQFASLIHQSSHLFSKVIEAGNPQTLINLFKVNASSYWDNHYTFDKSSVKRTKNMGIDAMENIIINTLAPFIFTYGRYYNNEDKQHLALRLLEHLSPEKNSIMEHWSKSGIKAQNALQSQALLELYNNECFEKKCLQCSIGYFVIKNN